MSQENVEIAKDFYDAYNARNSEALDRLLHPEAEITTLSARGGLGGDWSRGTTRQYFEQLDEAWTGLRIEIEEYREVGERVVALGVARGAGTSSHVELASRFRGRAPRQGHADRAGRQLQQLGGRPRSRGGLAASWPKQV